MVFEGEFLSAGAVRWNLGWPTPNFAGAFVSTLLPWCWGWVRRGDSNARQLVVTVVAAFEVLLWFALAKTCSRGALIAAAAALLYFVLAAPPNPDWRARVALWLPRVLVAIGCVAGTGLADRFAWSRLVGDGSVTHRLELWSGGLVLAHVAPFRGWGAGESGRAYLEWVQPPQRAEGYTTMVNSYLDIGVQYGLVALGVALASGITILMLAWKLSSVWRSSAGGMGSGTPARQAAYGTLAAGATLVAWGMANVFSTLWTEPRLWFVPAVSAAIVMWALIHKRRSSHSGVEIVVRAESEGKGAVAKALATGAAAGVAVPAALWLCGCWIEREVRYELGRVGPEGVHLRATDAAIAAGTWQVWPDTAVLGRQPGKEIRRWLEAPNGPREIVVHPGNTPPLSQSVAASTTDASGTRGWVLFGRQVDRLEPGRAVVPGRIVLIHPLGAPPAAAVSRQICRRATVSLVLPEIDERGDRERWRKWAATHGVRITIAPSVGVDIRAMWPAIWILLQ